MRRPLAVGVLVLTASLAMAIGALAASAPSAAPERAAAPAQDGNLAEGETLFLAGCSSCHGTDGEGGPYGPPLTDAGAASADYQLRTGRMPAAEAEGQTQRKDPAYDEDEVDALVAFVASLGEGPEIPTVELDPSLLQQGREIFIVNCAPCHGATANGGATGGGWVAPPLAQAEPITVAEAVIVGPGQMPAFAFEQEQLNALATYVEFLRTDANPGGFEIGGIGPVPEGLVAWAFGVTSLVAVVILVGREWTPKVERSVENPDR
ncbi:MAG: cytochrome bc1 complex diheme cytochrome c subunit [Candidatus Limnocylindria bacterium]